MISNVSTRGFPPHPHYSWQLSHSYAQYTMITVTGKKKRKEKLIVRDCDESHRRVQTAGLTV